MSEPQADVLVDQLRRANRRWKLLALGTLAALVLAVVGLTTLTVARAARARAAEATARAEAEQARQAAKDALEESATAKRHADQILYASNLQRATQAWDEGAREKQKP
jgi:flagellar biosynthesis/type III secretory pathway M-ring protein FliF/YscJ